MPAPVGLMAPCTKSVYKAAHGSVQVSNSSQSLVSAQQVKHRDQDRIGPHGVVDRACLFDFLQSHLLLLPQTYIDLPPARKVSYKEVTTSTDSSDDFDVTDWSTLDYASISHPIFPDITLRVPFFSKLSIHAIFLFFLRTALLSPLRPASSPNPN